MINIAAKVLPVCDFDAGSVVYLREGCFDIDKDIMLAAAEDMDNNHHYHRSNNKTRTTATTSTTTNTTTTSTIGAGLGTLIDTPDVLNTRRGSFVNTDKRASFSLPSQSPTPTGAGAGTASQLPWSSRREKNSPSPITGAYDLIFEFVVPTTMIVIPRLRLESAIAVTKEEVKNRQSTTDIEGIVKWVYRAETMVVDRISSLSSWLQGGGITVDRKKTHVVTLREIAHRKHW